MNANPPTLEDLQNYILESETVKCAVTEAVHRFYNDRCFSPYTHRPYDTPETKAISKIHDIMSCLYAGWRFKLKKAMERYHGWEDTRALNLSCKP